MAATTALDVINGALRALGVIGIGITASTEQQTEGMEQLNLMIDTWRNEKLMCPFVVQESFALTAGDGEYSIGPGGDWNTLRPISLQDSCFVEVSSVRYPVTLIGEAQFNSIPVLAVTGSFPQLLYYEPTFPLGTIKLWPLPGSGNTLYISALKQMVSLAGAGTTIGVPPGYDLAYRTNLAVQWSASFGIMSSASLLRAAAQSKRSLRQVNARIGVLRIDAALTSRFPNSGYIYGDIT